MTYLDRILEVHRAAAAADRRDLAALEAEAAAMPPTRGLRAALEGPWLSVIAEVKRRSPSKGDLAVDLDPAALGAAYAAGGASAVSVLTDAAFFGGSPSDLEAVRSACTLPVLRKDFTVSAHDVLDARCMGADGVLLIVAALTDQELAAFLALAASVGLDALVEVHDDAELARALALGATLVGVNQRDLVTFAVDPERAERLADQMPAGVVSVAESGITGPLDAARLAAAGYDAVLVGESLVRSADPAAAVRALRGAGA